MTHQTRISDFKDFESSVARIRVAFLGTLEDHLSNLRKVADTVGPAERPEIAGFARMSEIAHRIHGVARTLGFSALGEVAVEAERAADAVLDGPVPAGQVGKAIGILADLIAAIATILGEERARLSEA